MEAWELCLQTMRIQEVSSFKVKPILSHPYPSVAKTLRDAFNKDASRPHQHHHVCGMMAMQMEGGIMGYDDLNALMKAPQELEFIIELLTHELPEEYVKDSWQMDPEEKLESVSKLRAEGNQLYIANKFSEAADVYGDAIGRLDQLMLREKPQDEEWLELRRHKVPLLLNYSQCKLTLKEYYPVLDHCTEALEIEPDNVKALFRRGKAHIGVWNPNEAKTDLQKVCELDSSLVKACAKELKVLEQLEKDKDQQDREKFKKLF